jgi:hypothetical protein
MRKIIALVALLTSAAAQAAVFVVDTTSDSAGLTACTADPGDCSLRGAIARANASGTADTIEFDIPMSEPGCDAVTGICRIVIDGGSGFPIGQPLTVDGYTQPGAQPNTIPAPGANNAQLKIEITPDPPICPSCIQFQLSSSSMELRGLALFHGQGALFNATNSRLTVRGNWFGVTADGSVPEFSGAGFIFRAPGAHAVVIGGPDPADRNVLAGSGTDVNGLPGGGANEVRLFRTDQAPEFLLQGNLFGLQPDGVSPLPFQNPFIVNPQSADAEIRILDNRFVRPPRTYGGFVGGALDVQTSAAMTQTGLIQGNVFGLGVDGSRIGVERAHIFVSTGNSAHALRLLVGGMGAGEGNTFAAGTRFGGGGSAVSPVFVNGASFIEFVGNTMLGNEGLGLDLPPVSQRLLNDPGDADTGFNNLQNHPKVSAYSVSGSSFDVTYLVDSHPDHSTYPLRVDFYRALGDEGEILLDSDVYETVDAQQPKSVTLSIPPGVALSEDDVLVAIATDDEGRSSEFSFDTLTLAIQDFPDPHPAGLPFTVQAITTATSGPFKPNGVVRVSMSTSPPTTCVIELAPTETPSTSAGSCEMIPTQIGNFTITATYDTFAGAFASPTGTNVVATAPHQVTDPGPEQISLRGCLASAVEGRDLTLLVERRSGGVTVASVDLVHEPGTAVPDVHYIPPPDQTLTWAPGDLAPKPVTIPILSGGAFGPGGTFHLRIQDPVNTAIVPTALMEIRIAPGAERLFGNGFEGSCP